MIAEASVAAPPSGAAVEVSLLGGECLSGRVNNFNPQQTSFFLHVADAARRLDFAGVQSVAFLRPAAPAPRANPTFPASAQLLTVRFNDGAIAEGIAENPAGNRRGIYLVPTDDERVERLYLPLSAVREMVAVKRLGEILIDQRMATREMVEQALRRQREVQAEPLGSILVREAAVSPGQLDQGLALQRQRAQSQPQSRIGEILIEQGFATRAEIDQALEIQSGQRNRRLGTVLIELGYASPKMIGIALALQHNVPFVNLSASELDPDLTRLVPTDFAERWHVVPYALELDLLTVAVSDPSDLDFKPELSQRLGLAVTEVVATPQDLERARVALYGI